MRERKFTRPRAVREVTAWVPVLSKSQREAQEPESSPGLRVDYGHPFVNEYSRPDGNVGSGTIIRPGCLDLDTSYLQRYLES